MTPRPLDVFGCPLDGINLIEASAGTGKTWAICGLYLRLLLERGLEVQQILVVTFTNAAAAELRDRIRQRLHDTRSALIDCRAVTDPHTGPLLQTLRAAHGLTDGQIAGRLELALQTFDEAAIFTIHGFCQRALGDASFSAGAPIALELLTDDSELHGHVVHDFWRRHVAGGTLGADVVAHLVAENDSPGAWAKLLRRRLGKPLSTLVWPEPSADAPHEREAHATAHLAARATWRAERDRVVACVVEALARLDGRYYRQEHVDTAALSWDEVLRDPDPFVTHADPPKLDLLTAERLQPRKGHRPPDDHGFFAQAAQLLRHRGARRQALADARQRLLRHLLADGPERLRAFKREHRVVAFDDLLFNLHQALVSSPRPGLAAALRERFPAALIDEFQDTDPLQFAIFQAIYASDGAEAPLFLVGDPKQAIYSFRNADLHTYLRARPLATAHYSLAENQRSTPDLIAAINGLFGANPAAFVLPGLDHPAVGRGAKPRPAWHDATPLPRTALQLWSLPADAATGQPLMKPDAQRVAATATAGEIARLLAAGQRGEIRSGDASLAGRDIAVLVRSHAQGAMMRRALAALRVGSVELSQASVFESTDAADLARVLAAVLEPTRESLLRAALATELLGFDAEGIAAIAADEDRLLGIVTRFADYRELWLRRGVGVMLRSLTGREGVDARLLARPDGERRLTNLLHLAEALQQAAELEGSPESLLHWLQRQVDDPGSDDAAQLRLESDRNLVQIVTIHKSKGLEYPVVFCPFLWDGHASKPATVREGREYHADDGSPVLDFRHDLPGEIKARIALEGAAETVRLIYVALTRAVQRCYLVVGNYSAAAGKTSSVRESVHSRLNSLVAGAGMTAADWAKHALPPAAIDAAWARFAAAHPRSVDLDALPGGPWGALDVVRPVPGGIVCRQAPAHIEAGWWIGSYSSLAFGARHEGAAVDHDARVEPTDDARVPPADDARAAGGRASDAPVPTTDDILDFPRGAAAGNCIHAVFERADFADPSSWPAAIAAALREQPQTGLGDAAAARLPSMLGHLLADVLATRLPGGMALADVPRARRQVELEFTLPADHLSAAALASLLREHAVPVPPLAFGTLDGYLRGFIDLVFEHAGRYWIVDWKSNHLGRGAAFYAPPALAAAMAEHGYPLQALIYTLALHRLLQRRLPGYRYDDHFGGAMYLFVRGVRPGWAGADGRPAGVHVERPSLRLVDRLSALLAGGAT